MAENSNKTSTTSTITAGTVTKNGVQGITGSQTQPSNDIQKEIAKRSTTQQNTNSNKNKIDKDNNLQYNTSFLSTIATSISNIYNILAKSGRDSILAKLKIITNNINNLASIHDILAGNSQKDVITKFKTELLTKLDNKLNKLDNKLNKLDKLDKLDNLDKLTKLNNLDNLNISAVINEAEISKFLDKFNGENILNDIKVKVEDINKVLTTKNEQTQSLNVNIDTTKFNDFLNNQKTIFDNIQKQYQDIQNKLPNIINKPVDSNISEILSKVVDDIDTNFELLMDNTSLRKNKFKT